MDVEGIEAVARRRGGLRRPGTVVPPYRGTELGRLRPLSLICMRTAGRHHDQRIHLEGGGRMWIADAHSRDRPVPLLAHFDLARWVRRFRSYSEWWCGFHVTEY